MSFRLAQFMGLICLLWILQKISNKYLSTLNSWLFAFTIGTIPVLWHVGLLAEQAIWTALFWAVFLLYLAGRNGEKDTAFDYIGWISAISVATLLRQSAFVALVPILVLYVFDLIKNKNFDAKNISIAFMPLLVMLPFLLHSIIRGTPATYAPGEMGYVPQGASSFLRVWIALQSGVVFTAIANSIGLLWSFFLVPAFLCFYRKPEKLFALFLFFAGALYVFYSIKPDLWGVGRYQAEYVVPFVVLGFFCAVRLLQKFHYANYLLPAIFIPLIAYNVYIFKNLAHFNKPIDMLVGTFNADIKVRNRYAILSEFPYAYREAFREVRKLGYGDSVYVAGVTYGVFGEILNGFTVSEVLSVKDLAGTNPTADDIHRNEKIKAVLVSDFADKEELIAGLKELGWQERGQFKNIEYGSTIFLFLRR